MAAEQKPEKKHWIDYIALVVSLAALLAAFWPTLTARFDVRVFLDFEGTNGSLMFLNPGTETAVLTEVGLYWGAPERSLKRGIERLDVEPFVLRPTDAATRSISLAAPIYMLKWQMGLEPAPSGIHGIIAPHLIALAMKGEQVPIFIEVMAKDMKGDEYQAQFEIGMGIDKDGRVDQSHGNRQTKRLIRSSLSASKGR
jgi:hypothetical protein